MKIRSGFVSNSSSSSFLVVFPQPEKCEHCGRSNLDVFDIIESKEKDSYGRTCIEASNFEETVSMLKEWFEIGTKYEDSQAKRQYEKYKKKLDTYKEKGYNIAIVEINDHDDKTRTLIDKNSFYMENLDEW